MPFHWYAVLPALAANPQQIWESRASKNRNIQPVWLEMFAAQHRLAVFIFWVFWKQRYSSVLSQFAFWQRFHAEKGPRVAGFFLFRRFHAVIFRKEVFLSVRSRHVFMAIFRPFVNGGWLHESEWAGWAESTQWTRLGGPRWKAGEKFRENVK